MNSDEKVSLCISHQGATNIKERLPKRHFLTCNFNEVDFTSEFSLALTIVIHNAKGDCLHFVLPTELFRGSSSTLFF